jgi:hypothetical protein
MHIAGWTEIYYAKEWMKIGEIAVVYDKSIGYPVMAHWNGNRFIGFIGYNPGKISHFVKLQPPPSDKEIESVFKALEDDNYDF